ncbi:amidohydrolase family protein [Rhizobium leguminosarum]|uniref:amidohydrolase family protein n=1 Tax=Rhizobium leguminosarum TaxID=384 RepID=UPI001C968F2C|nr:amidohydrolase family protein [Rhizobium leguminosarum]MBY5377280.1 amidohydrolase family protein [Rhizobium leguminosarum]
MSRKILIKNGVVATLAGHRGDGQELDLLIDGKMIVAVEPSIEADDVEVVDASNMLVMPGFVDTHRHTWQTMIRGLASDWSLAQYAKGAHATFKHLYTPSDIYLGNLLGRIEALYSGITTMLDWSHGISSPEHADAAAQGLIDAPGRSVFGYSAHFGFPNNTPIDRDLRRLRESIFSSNDGLVTLALGLRGPQYTSIETTEADVRLARELDLNVTVHGGSAGWGRNRPVGRMFERGLLDHRTTVVHCNTIGDDEVAMMGECGCTASVSPFVEIQMGFGWPATGRLLKRGIRPSLSIDTCTAVCGDMFRTMNTALIAQRGLDNEDVGGAPDQQGLALRCRDVVEFATIEGARACGLESRIGTLEVGKEADLIFLKMDDPTVFPVNYPLGMVAISGHPGLVDTVMVAGKFVKRGGELIGVDLPHLRQLGLQSRDALLARARDEAGADPSLALDGTWQPPTAEYTADAVTGRNASGRT